MGDLIPTDKVVDNAIEFLNVNGKDDFRSYEVTLCVRCKKYLSEVICLGCSTEMFCNKYEKVASVNLCHQCYSLIHCGDLFDAHETKIISTEQMRQCHSLDSVKMDDLVAFCKRAVQEMDCMIIPTDAQSTAPGGPEVHSTVDSSNSRGEIKEDFQAVKQRILRDTDVIIALLVEAQNALTRYRHQIIMDIQRNVYLAKNKGFREARASLVTWMQNLLRCQNMAHNLDTVKDDKDFFDKFMVYLQLCQTFPMEMPFNIPVDVSTPQVFPMVNIPAGLEDRLRGIVDDTSKIRINVLKLDGFDMFKDYRLLNAFPKFTAGSILNGIRQSHLSGFGIFTFAYDLPAREELLSHIEFEIRRRRATEPKYASMADLNLVPRLGHTVFANRREGHWSRGVVVFSREDKAGFYGVRLLDYGATETLHLSDLVLVGEGGIDDPFASLPALLIECALLSPNREQIVPCETATFLDTYLGSLDEHRELRLCIKGTSVFRHQTIYEVNIWDPLCSDPVEDECTNALSDCLTNAQKTRSDTIGCRDIRLADGDPTVEAVVYNSPVKSAAGVAASADPTNPVSKFQDHQLLPHHSSPTINGSHSHSMFFDDCTQGMFSFPSPEEIAPLVKQGSLRAMSDMDVTGSCESDSDRPVTSDSDDDDVNVILDRKAVEHERSKGSDALTQSISDGILSPVVSGVGVGPYVNHSPVLTGGGAIGPIFSSPPSVHSQGISNSSGMPQSPILQMPFPLHSYGPIAPAHTAISMHHPFQLQQQFDYHQADHLGRRTLLSNGLNKDNSIVSVSPITMHQPHIVTSVMSGNYPFHHSQLQHSHPAMSYQPHHGMAHTSDSIEGPYMQQQFEQHQMNNNRFFIQQPPPITNVPITVGSLLSEDEYPPLNAAALQVKPQSVSSSSGFSAKSGRAEYEDYTPLLGTKHMLTAVPKSPYLDKDFYGRFFIKRNAVFRGRGHDSPLGKLFNNAFTRQRYLRDFEISYFYNKQTCEYHRVILINVFNQDGQRVGRDYSGAYKAELFSLETGEVFRLQAQTADSMYFPDDVIRHYSFITKHQADIGHFGVIYGIVAHSKTYAELNSLSQQDELFKRMFGFVNPDSNYHSEIEVEFMELALQYDFNAPLTMHIKVSINGWNSDLLFADTIPTKNHIPVLQKQASRSSLDWDAEVTFALEAERTFPSVTASKREESEEEFDRHYNEFTDIAAPASSVPDVSGSEDDEEIEQTVEDRTVVPTDVSKGDIEDAVDETVEMLTDQVSSVDLGSGSKEDTNSWDVCDLDDQLGSHLPESISMPEPGDVSDSLASLTPILSAQSQVVFPSDVIAASPRREDNMSSKTSTKSEVSEREETGLRSPSLSVTHSTGSRSKASPKSWQMAAIQKTITQSSKSTPTKSTEGGEGTSSQGGFSNQAFMSQQDSNPVCAKQLNFESSEPNDSFINSNKKFSKSRNNRGDRNAKPRGHGSNVNRDSHNWRKPTDSHVGKQRDGFSESKSYKNKVNRNQYGPKPLRTCFTCKSEDHISTQCPHNRRLHSRPNSAKSDRAPQPPIVYDPPENWDD